jgi:hypothetical protein
LTQETSDGAPGSDNKPLVKAALRGFSISYRGKTLLSTRDPVSRADRAAAAATKKRTLYFCPSPLLGYGLEKALQIMSADSALLCVESDPALSELSASSIPRRLLDDPRLLFAGASLADAAALCAAVQKKWPGRKFRRLEILKLSGGWVLDSAAYDDLAAALGNEIAVHWSNAMTLIKLGRRFMCNTIRNLPLLETGKNLSRLSFGKAPLLVLGAGPSLDPFLDALVLDKSARSASRSFKIICVDTCVPALRERNLRADLVVILESQFWNCQDFTGAGRSRMSAAVDLSSYPGSAAALGGDYYFFFTPWTRLSLFDRMRRAGILPLETMPPLGSVGLSAVELARRLGGGPIICAGIDFSFTLDKSHARSTPWQLALLAGQNRLHPPGNAAGAFRAGVFPARSKSGTVVRSNPAMRNYRNLFEQEFSRDERIYDVEGSGLPLGVKATLSITEAVRVLTSFTVETNDVSPAPAPPQPDAQKNLSRALRDFAAAERKRLEDLRDILCGKKDGPLDTLLDETDYLWAHFPECAGAGGRPAANLPFLKRVRTEIDPFIRLFLFGF